MDTALLSDISMPTIRTWLTIIFPAFSAFVSCKYIYIYIYIYTYYSDKKKQIEKEKKTTKTIKVI